MSNVATPAANNDGLPSVPPAATPTVATEMLTLSKGEVEQLRRDAARASANQRKADLYDKMGGKGGSHFKPAAPPVAPTQEELKDAGTAEDRKAERGLLSLALEPAYRQALDSDPTLRDLLTKNPLAVLPLYAPEALDADDAVSLVKEFLNKRIVPPTPPVTPPAAPPATPPSGAVNPTAPQVDEAYEAAKKLPKTESAIAEMVKIKMSKGGKK